MIQLVDRPAPVSPTENTAVAVGADGAAAAAVGADGAAPAAASISESVAEQSAVLTHDKVNRYAGVKEMIVQVEATSTKTAEIAALTSQLTVANVALTAARKELEAQPSATAASTRSRPGRRGRYADRTSVLAQFDMLEQEVRSVLVRPSRED